MKNYRISLLLFFLLLGTTAAAQNLKISFQGLEPVNGTQLFVKSTGKGEPVIIIHGGPLLDHSYLFPYLEPLSENYRLFFYDQRLSGRSSADVDSSEVSLANFIEDIDGIRNRFGLDKVHIIAHSWGGLLGMKYAIRYPERLHSLVLLNSMPPSWELWQQENNRLAGRVSRQDSLDRQAVMQSGLLAEKYPEAVEKLLKISFRSQFHNRQMADSLSFYIPEDYRKRSSLFANLMPELSSYSLVDELKNISAPTFIIYGDGEPASKLSAPVLQDEIPNARMAIIKESGHFPFIEHKDEVLNLIRDFLDNP